MKSYINTYFRIKLKISEEWSFRSSSNNPESKTQYQNADDDIPTQEGDFRTLILLLHKDRGQHKLIGAEFLIGIQKQTGERTPGEFENKEGIIESSYGEINILENQAKFIKVVKQFGNDYLFSKTVTYEIRPNIWLDIHFNGDTMENFQSTENLLKKMSYLS